jgi:hypothetical protein
MTAIKQPEIGSPFPSAAAAMNRNVDILDRRTSYQNGTLGKGVLGFIGDSMAGYSIPGTWYSPLSTARMLAHDFDLLIDNRAYFWNLKKGQSENGYTATEDYPRKPAGQRGYNFGVGGTDIAYMRDVQLPYIKEAPPEFAFLSCFQNDSFAAVGDAATKTALVQGVLEQLLDLGINIVMAGLYPKRGIGEGNETAYAKHWTEHALRVWCEKRQGIRFVPLLDILKAEDYTVEQSGVLNWRPGYSGDGTHYLPLGARAMHKRYAEAFRGFVGRATTPTYDGATFNRARNPYGNLFGPAGLFIGTGGKVNGVVSGDMPAGWELLYDTTKGYQVTPTLTGNPEWPLRLTFAGTPSGDDMIVLRTSASVSINPAQPMEIHGRMRWVNMRGLGGVGLGDGLLYKNGRPIVNLPGAGGTGETAYIMPFALTEDVTLRSARPTPYFNEYGNQADLDFQSSVHSGVTISGAAEYGRAGMFRNDNTLPANV